MNWLEELRRDHSIINFEMEAPLFLSFTRRANIPAAVICAAMLNRLNGDQITTPKGKLYRPELQRGLKAKTGRSFGMKVDGLISRQDSTR